MKQISGSPDPVKVLKKKRTTDSATRVGKGPPGD